MLKVDGFDDAIIGVATPWVNHSRTDVLVYDAERIRAILMKDGMTSEEAREYIEFNIEGLTLARRPPSSAGQKTILMFKYSCSGSLTYPV